MRNVTDSDTLPALATGDNVRPRRLRESPALRRLVRETRLDAAALVHPLFVTAGSGLAEPIVSMPGQSRWTVESLETEIGALSSASLNAVLLFGIPALKDARGSGASDANGPVPRAIAGIQRANSDMIIIADVCLCEYTDHGHCGLVTGDGQVDNDATLPLLAEAAVAYADAGAHVVAPSAMMDHQVGAIRRALDDAGHRHVAIMAYSAKYASAFYGPFRDAAGSTPSFGDRRAYQMDAANAREALREVRLDLEEGADIVMVKPAGPYLDIVRQVRDAVDVPLAAYQVSGEYAMLKAAAERGWIDERRAVLETLTGIRRAGADIVITYYAKQAAEWLRAGE